VVVPRNEADVLLAVKAAVARRIPITVRGGGTGNYGQAVPLEGGVMLDMTGLDRLVWSKPGLVRAQSGANMHDMDDQLRPSGFELRMHPSTKRSATIGGFVAGGSGGVGSVAYGGLREPGNIVAARIVTMEAEPRVIELRGDAAQKINRAYGTTGIITELELPLAPAWPWIDVIVACDDFFDAVAIGRDIAMADGIVKKLLAPIAWPIPSFFTPIKAHCPDGKSLLLCMIAAPSLESFKAVVAGRGAISLEKPTDESPANVPLYEYAWNHTTLQVLKSDRSVTYLQCLYPHDRLMESVREMAEMFPDEVLPHLEFIRFAGRVTCSALPVVRYRSVERLNDIIQAFEAAGVMIANPHVYTLEDGSRHKRADADQLGFKREIDPHGLLNPGKMRTFVPVDSA
jgi:FAD/FMN-containing dehydrogenase